MTLSSIAILLGLTLGLPQVYGILKPVEYAQTLRKFPRYTPVGYVLMLTATAWFLHNLSLEEVSDFLTFKPALYALFGAVGVGACVFVKDFLPVRGLAVLLLLMAKSMVDAARWIQTDWRLIIVIWAYVWIIAGMWLTISPWRLRDLIHWSTITPERTRLLSGVRLAFFLLVLLLGLTVFRSSGQTPAMTAAIVASPSHAGAR
jgi:hypothetical protein